MQRSNFNKYLNLEPVQCSACKKPYPAYFHLLTDNKKPSCYQCVKSNDELLRNLTVPYKDYLEDLLISFPLPDFQFAQQCAKSLQEMKNSALKIINDLRKNIDQFQFDILQFYTETKVVCEGYIEKIKSLSNKSREEILQNAGSIFNQQKYLRNIKSKYKVSSKIKDSLEQLKIKIPSVKTLAKDIQKSIKRHSIGQVPVHSAISIRGVLYLGTADGKIVYEDQDQWKQIKAHQSLIRSLAYDGMYTLYSGSDDFKIKAWDLHNKKQPKCIAQFGTIIGEGKSYHRDIVVFNKGKTMASTRGTFDGFKIRLWQLKTYKNIKKFQGHTNYIRGMSMIKQDQVITVSDDKTIRVWNVHTAKCSKIVYHTKKIQNLHCNKEMGFISVWDQDNRVMVYDGKNLNLIQCWPIGKKILCSEGKERLYFGLSSQIVIFNWYGIKLGSYPLQVNFVPGTMLEVEDRLVVCDGKGKCLQIPFCCEELGLRCQ